MLTRMMVGLVVVLFGCINSMSEIIDSYSYKVVFLGELLFRNGAN